MIHKDKYGLIGQVQPDSTIEGGDAACWTGHYVYLTEDLWYKDAFRYANTFEVAPGAYVRHPEPSATAFGFGSHYKSPYSGCMSRDQLTGVIAGLIAQKDEQAILRMMGNHIMRGFLFAYNTIDNGSDPKTAKWKMPDLTLFDFWALYLRGFGLLSWVFWPILCVLDFHLLLNTIYFNLFDKDNDQINYAIKMIIAKDHVPTPVGYLARLLLNKDKLMAAIKDYWCGWRDNSGMVELYEKKVIDL